MNDSVTGLPAHRLTGVRACVGAFLECDCGQETHLEYAPVTEQAEIYSMCTRCGTVHAVLLGPGGVTLPPRGEEKT